VEVILISVSEPISEQKMEDIRAYHKIELEEAFTRTRTLSHTPNIAIAQSQIFPGS
jgi:hypothetical protein